jgi:hypothetical protein
MALHEAPEGGYGWVSVLSLFVNIFIIAGIQSSTGVIHTELMKSTSTDLAVIGWIGSLLTGLCTLACKYLNRMNH